MVIEFDVNGRSRSLQSEIIQTHGGKDNMPVIKIPMFRRWVVMGEDHRFKKSTKILEKKTFFTDVPQEKLKRILECFQLKSFPSSANIFFFSIKMKLLQRFTNSNFTVYQIKFIYFEEKNIKSYQFFGWRFSNWINV